MSRQPKLPSAVAAALGPSRPRSSRRRTARPPGVDAFASLPPGARILAFDPSSSAVGYALMDAAATLLEFGVIRPPASLPAPARIDRIVAEARSLLAKLAPPPAVVVMEFSAGHQAGRLKRKVAGLAVMGQAQGALWAVVKMMGYRVVCTAEGWTAGRPKVRRAGLVGLQYPAYRAWARAGHDAAMDCADSIGIGLWFLGKLKAEAMARTATKGGRA